IVLADKIANDFYIPPGEPFKPIGALPYIYEGNLRRFCKTHQGAIDRGLLDVCLWRHETPQVFGGTTLVFNKFLIKR
ncbi:MAG: hypothetical protein JJE39_12515, partial [Vicinamibacteria bacterium]|nr:hypothetical protein [Vicinamibacteria bacterium]